MTNLGLNPNNMGDVLGAFKDIAETNTDTWLKESNKLDNFDKNGDQVLTSDEIKITASASGVIDKASMINFESNGKSVSDVARTVSLGKAFIVEGNQPMIISRDELNTAVAQKKINTSKDAYSILGNNFSADNIGAKLQSGDLILLNKGNKFELVKPNNNTSQPAIKHPNTQTDPDMNGLFGNININVNVNENVNVNQTTQVHEQPVIAKPSHRMEILAAGNQTFSSRIESDFSNIAGKDLSENDQMFLIDQALGNKELNTFESNVVNVLTTLAKNPAMTDNTKEYMFGKINSHEFTFSSNKSAIIDALK